MIQIKKPYIEKNDQVVSLVSEVLFCGESRKVWYRTDEANAAYFAFERADAFVVALLPYALSHGWDIQSEAPISAPLLRNLEKHLIPYMANIFPQYQNIRISAPTEHRKINTLGRIGTGISCGVDCLSTVIRHGLEEHDNKFKIDTMCLFNTGYYGADIDKSSQEFLKFAAMGKNYAEKFGYHFLQMDTNVATLEPINFSSAVTFFTNSVVLAMQKMFSVYYFASSSDIKEFKPIFSESSSYDCLTLPLISTQDTTFISGTNTMSRLEKVSLVTKYPEVLEHVYPCVDGNPPHNCGECEKCRRTIMELEVLGKLDMAELAFDLTYYKKHRTSIYGYMLLHRHEKIDCDLAPIYLEIYRHIRQNKLHIPFGARWTIPYHFYRFKIRKPLRRFGKRLLGK